MFDDTCIKHLQHPWKSAIRENTQMSIHQQRINFPIKCTSLNMDQLWWANKYNLNVLYRGLNFKLLHEILFRSKVHNFTCNHIIDIRDLEYEYLLREASLSQSSESWYEISVCHTGCKQSNHTINSWPKNNLLVLSATIVGPCNVLDSSWTFFKKNAI